ncbi:carbohydrate-binding protein [Stieleria varia]|uniref:Uncharacterized protein n=1 Tax=Stieleria varia TaxID=2528005 RepID=A0A5C6BA89_9BACT|nr:hypothetical protein [Stieleria varia]TWU08186.1 hypothetical protein Pla52n_07680 [Stieleria varia]
MAVVSTDFRQPLLQRTQHPRSRRGSSYLEIQVAMVMLAIGVGGLYSIAIVQTKQTQRLSEVLPSSNVAVLNEAGSPWQKKLGAYASIGDVVTPKQSPIPHTDFVRIVDNSDSSAVSFYPSVGSADGWRLRSGPGYRGSIHQYTPPPDTYGFGYAFFNVADVPAGEIEVLVTYPARSSNHNAVRYYVYADGSYQITPTIDQTTPPTDVQYDGVGWDRLGTYRHNGGYVYVLIFQSYGYNERQRIRADAVCIRSRKSLSVISTTFSDSGGMTAILDEVERPPAP